MSKVMVNRQNLIQQFQNMQGQFNDVLKQANTKDALMQKTMEDFLTNLTKTLSKANQSLSTDNPLMPQFEAFKNVLNQAGTKWQNDIAKQKKGVEFRTAFNDSLLVFVFGKVKSGKSSLGNYMAWGNTDPSDQIKKMVATDSRPKYHSYDRSNVKAGDKIGEAETNSEFRVGATEATSSIQAFKLPGLTWVDSPGLHSVNGENGDLAKKYVEHADLILYTMTSGAPGRGSDLEEIAELLRMGKRILLLITQSDTTDFSVNDAGELVTEVIMKAAAERKKQQDYVLKELSNINANRQNLEIISLSACFAQENELNSAAFLDSGMGVLFETLVNINQSEGIKIKRDVPIKNFNNFLQSCIDKQLPPFYEIIQDLKQSIEKNTNAGAKAIKHESRKAAQEIREYIDADFSELEKYRNSPTELETQFKKFQKKWDEQYAKIANEALIEITAEVAKDLDSSLIVTIKSSSMNLPKFELETKSERVAVRTTESTRKKGAGLGALICGGIGLIFGPAGAALGASIGGALGGAMGSESEIIYKNETHVIGDNLIEIRDNTKDFYASSIEKQVQEGANTILSSFYDEMLELVEMTHKEVKKVETFFKSLINEKIKG